MATIDKSDGRDKIFRHRIYGDEYSFNVSYLPDDKEDWFCGVLATHMNMIHARAWTESEKATKDRIKEALGLPR